MAPLKLKGSIAELAVALDLVRRGYGLAIPFDATTGRCYYVPAALSGAGRSLIHLRVGPTANNQVRGTRWASDFTEI